MNFDKEIDIATFDVKLQKAFKKMQILAHEKDEHKDLSLFDSFNLELNDIGKKDFDRR